VALEISLNLFFFPDLLMTFDALNSKYLLNGLFDYEMFFIVLHIACLVINCNFPSNLIFPLRFSQFLTEDMFCISFCVD